MSFSCVSKTHRGPGRPGTLFRILGGLGVLAMTLGCHVTPKLQVAAKDTSMAVKSRVPFVHATSYSPDGKWVLTGGTDNAGRLWDLESMRLAATLKGHSGTILGTGFLADGRTGVTTSRDGSMRFWDVQTGKQTGLLAGFHSGLLGFSWNPSLTRDARYALGYTTNFLTEGWTVDLNDLKSGSVPQKIPGTFGTLSPDGRSILVINKQMMLIDRESGRTLWQVPGIIEGLRVAQVGLAVFSPDGAQVIAVNQRQKLSVETLYYVIETSTGRVVRSFGPPVKNFGLISWERNLAQINSLAISPDGRFVLSGNLGAKYEIWDVRSGEMVRQLKGPDEITGTAYNVFPSASFSPDGRRVIATSLGTTRHFDVATGEEIGSMIAFEDGEWLFMTPSGYYNSSEKGDQNLSVEVNGQPYSIAQLRESFYRPDLVKLALAGGSLKEYRKVADLGPPPAVSIVDTPAEVASQEVTVTLRIADAGGGIGDVRLYLNGSAVVLDHQRGLGIVPSQGSAESVLKYTVKLTQGPNTIRAIAFNGDNSMQSADAVQAVTTSYKRPGKPSLHAIVVGINEYKNARLQLRFAVADAELFASTLTAASAALFDQIIVHRLLTPAETTRERITQALKEMQTLNPDDLFVFYVASHGTVDDGEYFLITSEVGSTATARLKTDALSQNLLKELIANIPATKKLIVIDTCGAGKLGDAIQVAMLTRGMSEETAIKVLSRAVGSTVLAASSSVQEALEGYEGHGLFTYVVTEGMKGKADSDGDGFVKTTELANYVDDEVPRLAEKVFNRNQYPMVSPSGMGFPICMVR